MDRDAAIRLLRDHEPELRARGIMRLALFGSTARGEAGPDSDVDLLADLDPAARISLLDLIEVEDDLSTMFRRRVEIVTRPALHPDLQGPILAAAVPVF